ncbi:MAG: prepilin-type N-terminal cleavage/methylation domain-containing protein [Candidatus Eremiobacterota bacterium]
MRRGLTLAEVLTGVAILAVALLALISVQIFTLRATSNDARQNRALELAQSRLDSVIAVLANADPDRRAQLQNQLPPSGAVLPDPDNPDFRSQVVLTPDPSQPGPVLRQVEVQVFWDDKHGAHQVRLWTQYYDEVPFL